MSSTVIVCVADVLLPASSVAVNVRDNRVVASSVASNRLARHFDCHLAAVVSGRSVVKNQVVRTLRRVV